MYYSIMLNIKEKKSIVIGGGNIAYRKTKRLLESGGDVYILSPEIDDRFLEIKDKINFIQDEYKREYIKDAFLVIGATSSKDKNREIGLDCKELNILYNNVDNCENSSFITPAIIDKEGLLLAISSKGRFPAICKYVKRDLENRYSRFDEEYVNLLEKLRSLVLERYYENRIKIFYHALELNLKDLKTLYNNLMNNKVKNLKYIDGGCKMKVIVGTRGSDLAVTQTNHIIDMLKEKNPNVEFQVKMIKTKGDLILDKPIGEIGGKEIFIKEIEKELLDGTIDMAVHSMKDMPGELPKGLKLSYIPKREDHRDVLVLRQGINSLEELPKGAKIGTGSKRRKFQMLKYRDDLEIIGIRGNVQTRIDRIDKEGLDGVILAAAGINRLGLKLDKKVISLDEEIMISSPCQGILGLEIREDDEEMNSLLETISDENAEIQTKGERAFLKGTGGSCHVPVGAYCKISGNEIQIDGVLGSEDGSKLVRKSISGPIEDAEKLGIELADILTKEIY